MDALFTSQSEVTQSNSHPIGTHVGTSPASLSQSASSTHQQPGPKGGQSNSLRQQNGRMGMEGKMSTKMSRPFSTEQKSSRCTQMSPRLESELPSWRAGKLTGYLGVS